MSICMKEVGKDIAKLTRIYKNIEKVNEDLINGKVDANTAKQKLGELRSELKTVKETVSKKMAPHMSKVKALTQEINRVEQSLKELYGKLGIEIREITELEISQ